MPAALEVTLLEPAVTPRCPGACPFNGTCPTPVQAVAEKLWLASELTVDTFRDACYRYSHLAAFWTLYTGREVPLDAAAVREGLMERLAIVDAEPDPAPAVAPASAMDAAEAAALSEKFLRARDRARQILDAETRAAADPAAAQQELGV